VRTTLSRMTDPPHKWNVVVSFSDTIHGIGTDGTILVPPIILVSRLLLSPPKSLLVAEAVDSRHKTGKMPQSAKQSRIAHRFYVFIGSKRNK
jgi:hypothetical protein